MWPAVPADPTGAGPGSSATQRKGAPGSPSRPRLTRTTEEDDEVAAAAASAFGHYDCGEVHRAAVQITEDPAIPQSCHC